MLNKLRGRIDELSKNFKKEIEPIKKNQSEMKNKMKNTLQGINIRLDKAEDQTSNL